MSVLKKIAVRNVSRLLETKSKFDLFNKLIKMYDTLSPGNDKQLVEYMLNELGYTHSISGAWILLKNQQDKLREQQRMFPGLFEE
jgi:hypothetical protein